jgi:hypothetical protein
MKSKCHFKGAFFELRKCLYFPFFVLSVAGLNILFFMSEGAKGADGKGYSVWRVMTLSSHLSLTERIDYGWLHMWEAGLGPWTLLAAPVIAAAGYIYTNSEEKRNRAEVFIKMRRNRISFTVSKVVSGMLSSAITLTAAYLLFGGILFFFFPKPSDYGESFAEVIKLMYGDDTVVYVLKKTAGVFLMGVGMAIVPIVLCAFIDDRYLLVSLPLLAAYLYERIMQRLYYTTVGMEHPETVEALNIEKLPYLFLRQQKWLSLILLAGSVLICFISYHLIRFRRKDEVL